MDESYLSSGEQNALLAAAQVCATFSLLGSLFIVVCYARYKHLRKLSFTLILFLAISDIGADVTYFMGNPEDNRNACVTQGALQQFFQMSQVLWTVAIACVLRDVTVNLRMYYPHERKALMRRFHLAVWGAALISTLLPFTTDSYGSTGSWCWIETNPASDIDVGTMWRYLVLYCPLWLAIIFNIVVYARIVRVVRRFSAGIDGGGASVGPSVGPSAEQQARIAKFTKRLVWYPAVLIVSWTFATINRIQNAVDPGNPVFGLFLLHKSLVAFQGFFNALVYGSTDAVMSAVAQELLVERCLKASRGCRRGGRNGEAGPRDQGLDPEDEEDEEDGNGRAGVGMVNVGDESLGGFGDVRKDALSGTRASVVPADVTGMSSNFGNSDYDEHDSIEVYNPFK